MAKDTFVGYWFVGQTGFEIELVDLKDLRPIEVDPESRSSQPIHDSHVVESVSFDFLPSGSYSVPAVAEPGLPHEVFLLGNHVRSEEDRCAEIAIYIYEPAVGSVSVFPQLWFTNEFDLGYQWITNVGRDPMSGRIVGGGFRISPFVLDESNTRVEEFRDKPFFGNCW